MRQPDTRMIGSVGYFPEKYGNEIVKLALDILPSPCASRRVCQTSSYYTGKRGPFLSERPAQGDAGLQSRAVIDLSLSEELSASLFSVVPRSFL